ncbi:11307_t:CDS:2 [Ambispora gerdemannii]|uniref:11307_t:CDS:1 n=1 Tax=Ambispora gerdemannii TaxID=144530 RepID=A0A9N9B8Q4_9GLOM|nr:11307_t:CDS:2 [Ambispora gerdemannii]
MSHHLPILANRALLGSTRLLSVLGYRNSIRGTSRRFYSIENTGITQLWPYQASTKSMEFFSGGFTSKHYTPRPGEVLEFLHKHYQFPRKTGDTFLFRIRCPSCRPQKRGTLYTAVINVQKGIFQCDSCSGKGSWIDYVKLVSKSDSFQVLSTMDLSAGNKTTFSVSRAKIENYPRQLLEYPIIMNWCKTEKGLTFDTLQDYWIGSAKYNNTNPSNNAEFSTNKDQVCITFPRTAPFFLDPQATDEPTVRVVRVKACEIESGELVAFDPPTSEAGLFGYHLVQSDTEAIILAGNEFDAMAAYQETKIPATCLPNNTYQLPLEILPLLERFAKIYIWLDDDVAGQDAAEKFAQKLGINRCSIVRTLGGDLDGPVNASEALAAGKDLKEILRKARPLEHEQIIGFDHLKDAVYRELVNPNQVRGVQSTDLPGLNQILKGHRSGELTVFTGPTGIGKTTILSQISLDFCRSGVSTLWGSFEIPNVRLAKKMLQQFAGHELTAEEFFQTTERFQQLPMYFLKFFGSTDLTTVVDAMNHAIYAFDVQHVIIDNLQFMTADQGRFHDRWELQDRTVGTFRKFATERGVHITLVVHPKKDDREFLDLNSVFGSAKITQEADNVIIVQRLVVDDDEIRYLDIKKNRYDGTLAAIPFEFDNESCKIRQLTRNEHDRRAKGSKNKARQETEKLPITNRNANETISMARSMNGNMQTNETMDEIDENKGDNFTGSEMYANVQQLMVDDGGAGAAMFSETRANITSSIPPETPQITHYQEV